MSLKQSSSARTFSLSEGEDVFEVYAAYQPPAVYVEPSPLSHTSQPLTVRPKLRLMPPGPTSLTPHKNEDGYASFVPPIPQSPQYSASSPESATFPSTPEDMDELSTDGGESTWDLILYDVPWGEEFLDYTKGTLPGPDGTCLFLRSPTPVEKRRAVQACQMCRERKAKCSGNRPTCLRCIEKGLRCEYAQEARRAPGAISAKRKTTAGVHEYHPYSQRKPRLSKTSPATSAKSSPMAEYCRSPLMKMEDVPITLVDEESIYANTSNDSRSGYADPSKAQGYLPAAPNSPVSHRSAPSPSTVTTPLHAPTPLRRSPTASFLAYDAPQETQFAVGAPPVSYPTYSVTTSIAPGHLASYYEPGPCPTDTQHTQIVCPTYANPGAPAMHAVPVADTSHVVTSLDAVYPSAETYTQPYLSDYSASYDYEPAAYGYEYASVASSMFYSYSVGPSAQYLYAH